MDSEIPSLASHTWPYVSAALGAYGVAVLAKAEDQAADSTVGLGCRILQRIFGTRKTGDPLPEVLKNVVLDPHDTDLQAALRVSIRQALVKDSNLAEAVRELLGDTPAVSVSAAGERAIAAVTISGVAATGDNVTIIK